MGNDIALMTTGYIAARIAILAAFVYVFYRILRPKPERVRDRSRGNYANERYRATRDGGSRSTNRP